MCPTQEHVVRPSSWRLHWRSSAQPAQAPTPNRRQRRARAQRPRHRLPLRTGRLCGSCSPTASTCASPRWARDRSCCWLHGWPESWYSWRHQLPALAAAGYHAVAPDMRGYGKTRQAGGGRGLRHPPPHRATGRPRRCARREDGRRHRSRLGRAGRLERACSSTRSASRGGRDERAVQRARSESSPRRLQTRLRRQLLLHPLLPGAWRRGEGVRRRSARLPEPALPLARFTARAARGHRSEALGRRLDPAHGRARKGCRAG